MSTIRRFHPNSPNNGWNPWNIEEDVILKKEIAIAIKLIAQRHERTQLAIRHRIKKLAILANPLIFKN